MGKKHTQILKNRSCKNQTYGNRDRLRLQQWLSATRDLQKSAKIWLSLTNGFIVGDSLAKSLPPAEK